MVVSVQMENANLQNVKGFAGKRKHALAASIGKNTAAFHPVP
jgi:hypothetical protein